jgi:hypothetical protein
VRRLAKGICRERFPRRAREETMLMPKIPIAYRVIVSAIAR